MRDKRRDSGEYYPGGRVIARPGTAPQQVVVQWSDVQGKPQISPLPDRYREDDMKGKINEIVSKFATALAVALVGWTAFAGVTVQKARMGSLWNDEQIVTNVTYTAEAETDPTVPEWAKESNPPIDSSLTQGGKAADAKATGDSLAGKASRSDVKLVPVYSDWIFSDGKPHYLQLEYIESDNPYWTYIIDDKLADEHPMFDSKEDAEVALSLEFHHHSGDEPIDTTATRSVVAYKLGNQTPQLSPVMTLDGKLDKSGGTMTGDLIIETDGTDSRGFGLKCREDTFKLIYEQGTLMLLCQIDGNYFPISITSSSIDGPRDVAFKSDIPAPYTPPPYLRVYDEVRKCWWRGRMVNGVINWEVE